ncbi:MAG: hypothetical protein IJA52_06320 [Clostridia bacterium]|nr:hypothetical protein [Clostridia bacterium]
MNKKIRIALLALLTVAAIAFTTGCALERSPYEINNSEDYTVSVKYDANGGVFTTNTYVIVDSFNIANMDKNSDGDCEIHLISPDDKNRGNDAFKAIKNGYFLAGWYAERTETGKDSDGNPTYSYSDKWDFEKDTLAVDPAKEHSADKPVLTLYAAWVPLFEIEFYAADSGELLSNYVFDPTVVESIKLPAWDEETGAIEMYDFPERKGYTFNEAFLDSDLTEKLSDESFLHTGVIDYETGTAKDHVMKLYVDWTEGEWFRIYNTEQFLDNASVNGNYEILADLDFADEIWPTSFMYGNFTGEIRGNGHTMKNIEATQTNNSKVNSGLFGNITESAKISDLTFENVTFTVKGGTRVVGSSFGLFAGTLSNEAKITNVAIKTSTLKIDSSCYFGVDDYSIGLVCGMGDPSVIAAADIKAQSAGDEPDKIIVTTNGNTVTVSEKE